jgi:alkylation response protein AidB-like acyl-CoA dehydrogenase
MDFTIPERTQVHGGFGMNSDTVLCGFWTRERGARIYDGADEVHKALYCQADPQGV